VNGSRRSAPAARSRRRYKRALKGSSASFGVTGHGLSTPRMHLRALQRFAFDSVLFPYSYILMKDPAYAADARALIAEAERLQVAVQTIKAIVHKPWGQDSQTRAPWYRPLEDAAAIEKAVWWVLGQDPRLFLNTVGDIHVLPKVLDAARRFESAPSDADLEQQVQELGMAPLFPEPPAA
jgi:hypothetical protein